MISKKLVISGFAVVTILGAAGGVLADTSKVSAATDTANVTTADNRPAQNGSFDPVKGGHVGTNGVKETLLIGDSATKATAAAQKAVSVGTLERVETDAEGSAYEAHMVKSDGSHMTVKMDSNYNVTSTEDGFGPKK